MGRPLHVLIVEDSEDDALLLLRQLTGAGYDPLSERVDTPGAMAAALQNSAWDVVLSDYAMPGFTGVDALKLLKQTGLDLPFIIVSGKIGEDTAVELMKAGAHDYVMKGKLARLVPAVERELRDAQARREGKRAEQALRESEEKYRSLVQTIPECVYSALPSGDVLYMSPAVNDILGYSAQEFKEDKDLWVRLIHEDDRAEVLAKVEKLLKKGVPYDHEFRMRRKDGEIIWIKDRAQAARGQTGLPIRITGIMCAITERKRAEEELRQSYERLQRILEETVGALSSAVEKRDPYTAGHQRRVALLACSIAREIGWSEKQIEGIRVSALLHDIGKIYVPAEILTKPGVLSEAEMGIIRVHPQAGYDILKMIEFPWPVAPITLQHHERMDGSGYPSGLKSPALILEARILAVADVVEAMCSHRPYRPARGVDEALKEISRNRGILYDGQVVDACLRLFSEKGFAFDREE